jgi:hypothetical protein
MRTDDNSPTMEALLILNSEVTRLGRYGGDVLSKKPRIVILNEVIAKYTLG